jgi:hypothetical protein
MDNKRTSHMTKKQRLALLKSAEHWLKNYDCIEKGLPECVRFSIDACACCDIWFDEGYCVGCPIYEHTGVVTCGNTPYDEARYAIMSWQDMEMSAEEALVGVGKEYTFLVELAFK